MNKIYSNFYPYFSILLIEITKYIENIEAISTILGMTFQFCIGGLTIYKLVVELKNKLKK